ncbi:protein-tyrosine phosphatase-like protein [Xylariales sp. PMI_506]|nr:protein-tyrosine phosphatase-like protein [Xylariales sp. PMI_506]
MAAQFDNIPNFRDVGKTVNDFLGRKLLREGVLYRSARPDDATLSDRKTLREDYGIKTVIDLRTKTEHLKQAEKRQADLRIPALLKSNAALSEPVQIPGLRYLEIKVTGKKFENYLISRLSWRSYLRLICLYVTGYRIEAVRIMGQEVMIPMGLVGLGTVTLDHSGAEISEALRAFTEPSAIPGLVHCTQGKDRTGLIVCLALMTLHVPTEAIAHDYLLTREGLAADREQRLIEIQEIGLTSEWADCPTDFVQKIDEHIHERYGSIESYLDSIGFGPEDRARFVEALGA